MGPPGEELRTPQPAWARWPESERAYTLGVEEEVMLLHPSSWALAGAVDVLLPRLPEPLRGKVVSETHSAAVELNTGVHGTVGEAIGELGDLRAQLAEVLEGMQLRAGCSEPTRSPSGMQGGTAPSHPPASPVGRPPRSRPPSRRWPRPTSCGRTCRCCSP